MLIESDVRETLEKRRMHFVYGGSNVEIFIINARKWNEMLELFEIDCAE